MKRIFILVAVVAVSAGSIFAEQKVLIDFSKLIPDLNGENRQTLMDYSRTTQGSSFTAEQRAQLKTSLVLKTPREAEESRAAGGTEGGWLVELAASSRSVENNRLSYVTRAESKQFFGGEAIPVMGVRAHFPAEAYNSWALIKPTFDIPAYDFSTVEDDGTIALPDPENQDFYAPSRFEDGYGVLKNVGAIKSIAVRVYGLNFPHHLSVVYENDLGEQKVIPIGYLNFDGWARLTWDNPSYIQDLRARTMRLYPLYPWNSSYIKFVGFLVKRDAASLGGDFIAYFKDVEVIYDKAHNEEDADINDEGTWRIREDREKEKAARDSRNFGVDQVLRYVEGQRQAPPTEVWPDLPSSNSSDAATQ
ncbi:MAG: flagellar filament outer layer protein FlaA [Spirochaetaceae bacterium]|jgi:hypothetical protein|nr:flagellar filament outer layer protein FlaA [Spirochaetaceae bacterium]